MFTLESPLLPSCVVNPSESKLAKYPPPLFVYSTSVPLGVNLLFPFLILSNILHTSEKVVDFIITQSGLNPKPVIELVADELPV